MSKVKSWVPVQEKYLKKYSGNNIDKRNITAIEKYNAIEGNDRLKVKYSGLRWLYIGNKGERL